MWFTKGLPNANGMELARPTWVTTQRCTSGACVPCDKAEEGCFVYGHFRPHLYAMPCIHWVAIHPIKILNRRFYEIKAEGGSDLRYSAITITLKCNAGEAVVLWVWWWHLRNGNLKIYFNGVLQTGYLCLHTHPCTCLYICLCACL